MGNKWKNKQTVRAADYDKDDIRVMADAVLQIMQLRSHPDVKSKTKDERYSLPVFRAFDAISLNVTTGGGIVSVIDILKDNPITDTEIDWLRKMARCGRVLVNAVLGNDADDQSTLPKIKLKPSSGPYSPPQALTPIEELIRAVNTLEKMLPPEQKKGWRR